MVAVNVGTMCLLGYLLLYYWLLLLTSGMFFCNLLLCCLHFFFLPWGRLLSCWLFVYFFFFNLISSICIVYVVLKYWIYLGRRQFEYFVVSSLDFLKSSVHPQVIYRRSQKRYVTGISHLHCCHLNFHIFK